MTATLTDDGVTTMTTAATGPPALAAAGLGKRYGRRWALRGCDIAIPAGSVTALIGPNGAGKSTLLQIAAGLSRPTEGEIAVLGQRPMTDAATLLPRVGFVAQDRPLYGQLTVTETLTLGARLNPGWDAAFARDRVRQLGLDPRQRAGRLSGGQQAQLALVLALGKRPDLLLLDEPLAALDPAARREALQLLMATVAGTGATVVLSSHSVADVERVGDHLVILSGGRVVVGGRPGGVPNRTPPARPVPSLPTPSLAAVRRQPGRSSAPPTPTGRRRCSSAATARGPTPPAGPRPRLASRTW